MPDNKLECPVCGNPTVSLPDRHGYSYCTTTSCEWTNVNVGTALDRQVGGDWYKSLAIQPIEYCQKNKLGMAESGVVKYVTRHRYKGGEEDIRKAIHLLEMLLELEYS